MHRIYANRINSRGPSYALRLFSSGSTVASMVKMTAAYKVGNRFRPEHAVCSQAIHMRQQDRQRYYIHYLSEQ